MQSISICLSHDPEFMKIFERELTKKNLTKNVLTGIGPGWSVPGVHKLLLSLAAKQGHIGLRDHQISRVLQVVKLPPAD